jgi:hypothetical protein
MIIGVIQISTAWLLACFPRRLPKKPVAAEGFSTIAALKSTKQNNKPEARTFKRKFFFQSIFFVFPYSILELTGLLLKLRVPGCITTIADQQDSDSQ